MKLFAHPMLLRAAVIFGLLSVLPAWAQEEESPKPFSISFGGSMTAAGDMKNGGNVSGEVKTKRYHAEGIYKMAYDKGWVFRLGAGFEYLSADHNVDNSPIPEKLYREVVLLSAYRKLNEQWGLSASAAPGFYGDNEVSFSDGFNIPFVLLAHWYRSQDFSLVFGVRVNRFSDNKVFPVAGLDWKINEQWRLILGAPFTRLRFKLTEQLNLYAGLVYMGGSYAVDNKAAGTYAGRSLRDTYMTESEIRGTVGAGYTFKSGVGLRVEMGYAFEREFDYHERGVKLKIDPGFFGAVFMSYSF